jgi:predicted metal-binding membrane protein
MLPASIHQIRASEAAVGPFVGSYFLVWTAFGVACLMGDSVIHRIVDSTPFLLDRPWLVEAGLVALAGVYQFTPLKTRFLRACRHLRGDDHGRGGFRPGLVHARDCLGASGPLMLLMFGAGFANLWWMAGLTFLMAYETRGRHGERASAVAGFALLYLAVLALTNQGLPAWLPG